MGSAIFGSDDDERIRRLEASVERLLDETEFLKRRLTTYLGNGTALTYLADESPIFVNSDGYVGPINLINGGLYEDDNLGILLSYLKPGGLCLDIGANLGFFSLMLAKRLRAPGLVHAFEPHPRLCDLMDRTMFQNGMRSMVRIHDYGLSNRAGDAQFEYPRGDLGGGRIAEAQGRQEETKRSADHGSIADAGGSTLVRSKLRLLDDVLDDERKVDLVKIDVETHELAVLLGMRRVLARSPNIIVLFEKLDPNAGYESAIAEYLTGFGMELFAVLPQCHLKKLTLSDFEAFGGYVLAGRPAAVGDLDRARFSIYPAQLWVGGPSAVDPREPAVRYEASEGGILFHGPYWILKRGCWRLTVHGEVTGDVRLTIAEHFGRTIVDLPISQNQRSRDFIAERDLMYFETVARATSPVASIELEKIELHRYG